MLLQAAQRHPQLLPVHHQHPTPSCQDPSPSLQRVQTDCQAGAVTHRHRLSFHQRRQHQVLHQHHMSQPGLAHQHMMPVHGLASHFLDGLRLQLHTVMLSLALRRVQRQPGLMLHLGGEMCPAHPNEVHEGLRQSVCWGPQQPHARHQRRRAARVKVCAPDYAAQVMECAVQLAGLPVAACTEITWSLESEPVFCQKVQHWASCHAGKPKDVFLHCFSALCAPGKSWAKAFYPATKPQTKHVNLPVTWGEKLAEMEAGKVARQDEKECGPVRQTASVIEDAICQLKVLWKRFGALCPSHASHPQAFGPEPASGQLTALPSAAP